MLSLALALLGCSSAPPEAPPTVWNDVELDLGGGVVSRNRPDELAIEYPTLKLEGDAHGAASDLHRQLTGAGWEALYEEPGYHFSRKPSGEGVTVSGILFGGTVVSRIRLVEDPGVDDAWSDVVPDLSHAVGTSESDELRVQFFARPASAAEEIQAQVTHALEARGWTELARGENQRNARTIRNVKYERPVGGTAILSVESRSDQPGVDVEVVLRPDRE